MRNVCLTDGVGQLKEMCALPKRFHTESHDTPEISHQSLHNDFKERCVFQACKSLYVILFCLASRNLCACVLNVSRVFVLRSEIS